MTFLFTPASLFTNDSPAVPEAPSPASLLISVIKAEELVYSGLHTSETFKITYTRRGHMYEMPSRMIIDEQFC